MILAGSVQITATHGERPLPSAEYEPGGHSQPDTVNAPPLQTIAGLAPRTVQRFTPSPLTVVPVGSAISWPIGVVGKVVPKAAQTASHADGVVRQLSLPVPGASQYMS